MIESELPITDGHYSGPEENEDNVKVETAKKIAQSFLRQQFPLSKSGQLLQERVRETLQENDFQKILQLHEQLPTVESFHLELFEQLDLTADEEESVLGFPNLANIQVTKGCRHKCTFCAASASPKVDVMPFAALARMGEIKRRQDVDASREFESLRTDIKQHVAESTGIDLDEFIRSGLTGESLMVPGRLESLGSIGKAMRSLLFNHPLGKYLIGDLPKEDPEEKGFGLWPIGYTKLLESYAEGRPYHYITNYYDSDPFDYRDSTFPHRDGTAADFGDVVELLATEARPIYVTTAGIPPHDSIGLRAASKVNALAQQNPRLLDKVRISVNEFELLARRSNQEYLGMMRQTISSLIDTRPEVLLICEKVPENAFYMNVVQPLESYIEELRASGETLSSSLFKISRYSGPMADPNNSMYEDHHDVMACMPGMHVWPNGIVAEQNRAVHIREVRGYRPTSIGKQIYQRTTPKDRL